MLNLFSHPRLYTLLRNERGSALPLVGLGIMMMLAATGVAIDMGRVEVVQAKMSNALDAAGLAAGADIDTANAQTETNRYFYANFPAGYMSTTITSLVATPNSDNSVINLSASGTVPTTFMKLFGINSVAISATSQITRASEGMELVLVLDNTGSMNCLVTNENSCSPTGGGSSKIAALKTAAGELLDILYGSNDTIQNLWVGVVPFSQAVNIGTSYSGWLDTTADASLEFGPTHAGNCQAYSGSNTVLSGGSDFITSKATGVLTFTSNPTNGKTIVLNGVTWTFTTGTAGTNQTKVGSSLSSTLTTLASNLNSSTNNSIKVATYYATSTQLEITYDTAGTVGNAYTLAAGTSSDTVTTPTSNGTYSSSNGTCTYTLTGNSAAARFPAMTNWGGCVMARSSPYDTSDDVPSTAPFPAFDYPPTADGSNGTPDPWITVSTSRNSPYTTTTTYNFGAVNSSNYSGNYGPNLYCPQPLLPMVAEKSTVETEINSLTAGGSTLIDMGLAWGYRMLSPKWRGIWQGEMKTNNLPLDYNTPLMNKVLILMTDGENEFDPGNYTAYKFLDNDVLGTTNETTANTDIDNKTLAICTALKNNGVIIYTIGFGTSSDVNTTLLQNCASKTSYFFLAPTNAELESDFSQIGDSLANLRISQ